MKKTGLIYWPTGGNVEYVAQKIYKQFDKVTIDIYNAEDIEAKDLDTYDSLIIGGSTVGSETWEDIEASNKWNDLFKKLDTVNLKNKKIALFGLGNQILWPLNFVDNMIWFKKELEKRGAVIIGSWPTDGYLFKESRSVVDGQFVGLALDEDHQDELTDERVEKWTEQVKKEFGV